MEGDGRRQMLKLSSRSLSMSKNTGYLIEQACADSVPMLLHSATGFECSTDL